eukprot:7386561-Prymnesium_polylepis.2
MTGVPVLNKLGGWAATLTGTLSSVGHCCFRYSTHSRADEPNESKFEPSSIQWWCFTNVKSSWPSTA